MENNVIKETNILKAIIHVYEQSKGSGLKVNLFRDIDTQLEELSHYFEVTKLQAFIIANIFSLSYYKKEADIYKLSGYFECSPLKILEWNKDLDILVERKIIQKSYKCSRLKLALTNVEFHISKEITEAVIENQPIPEVNLINESGLFDLLEKLYDAGDLKLRYCIEERDLYRQAKDLLIKNDNIPAINKINEWDYQLRDKVIFLQTGWLSFKDDYNISLKFLTDYTIDKEADKMEFIRTVLNKSNFLCKNNFIEFIPNTDFTYGAIKISDKGRELLLGEDKDLFVMKNKLLCDID